MRCIFAICPSLIINCWRQKWFLQAWQGWERERWRPIWFVYLLHLVENILLALGNLFLHQDWQRNDSNQSRNLNELALSVVGSWIQQRGEPIQWGGLVVDCQCNTLPNLFNSENPIYARDTLCFSTCAGWLPHCIAMRISHFLCPYRQFELFHWHFWLHQVLMVCIFYHHFSMPGCTESCSGWTFSGGVGPKWARHASKWATVISGGLFKMLNDSYIFVELLLLSFVISLTFCLKLLT